jgi:ribosomal protein L35
MKKELEEFKYGDISKKINVRAGGSTSIGRPGGNHNTGKKNTDFNRKNRKGNSLSKADHNRLKNLI